MIHPSKVPAALFAIHLILIKARWLVGEGVESNKLYKILDWAEILPSLITRQEQDTTEEFRQMLGGLGEEFPEFAGFLGNFDRGVSWDYHPAIDSEPSAILSR